MMLFSSLCLVLICHRAYNNRASPCIQEAALAKLRHVRYGRMDGLLGLSRGSGEKHEYRRMRHAREEAR
jgi:hypothetical protein